MSKLIYICICIAEDPSPPPRLPPSSQLLSFAVSTYMNLVATTSRGAGGKTHLVLWTYEKAVR